jgi:hypothetical protein
MKEKFEAIRALIDAGANVNAVDKVRCLLSLQCPFDAKLSAID